VAEKETGPGVPLDKSEIISHDDEQMFEMRPEHDIRMAMPMGVPLEPEHYNVHEPQMVREYYPQYDRMDAPEHFAPDQFVPEHFAPQYYAPEH